MQYDSRKRKHIGICSIGIRLGPTARFDTRVQQSGEIVTMLLFNDYMHTY